MANLSSRIRQLRIEHGMTQTEFGKQFGIVKSTVSLYESGKSTPNDQIKSEICSFFNVSMDYLLGRTNFPNDVNTDNKTTNQEENLIKSFRNYQNNTLDALSFLNEFFPNILYCKSEEEEELLKAYRNISRNKQRIILGKALDEYDSELNSTSSVAAEEHFKRTGTDNLGK